MKCRGTVCAFAVLAVAAKGWAITTYTSGDASLAGQTVAEVDGGYLYPIGGPPPIGPVPAYAGIDERVVRNAAGTLDFYYRFSAVPGTPLHVDWIELQLIPSSTQLSVAYLADSTGLSPTDSAVGPAVLFPGDSTLYQYAAFGFDTAGAGVNLDTTGSKWLLLRTNATTFQQGFAFFVPQPVDFFALGGQAPGTGSPGGTSPEIFIPGEGAALPEPGPWALLATALCGWSLFRRLTRNPIFP